MNAQQLRNSILQEAIQGRLVPQNPADEPASVLLQRIRKEKERLVKEGKLKKKDLESKPIGDDEIPFEIPESWEWVRLGYIIKIASGDGLTSKQMKNGTIPVFGGNGITGFHNVANIHKETIVIGRVGFYCGSVHVTPKEAWVTDNAFITTYPEKQIDREFLVYILRYLKLGQNNNATAQPVVSGKKIYPMLFPLPPLPEQRRIVAKIEELLPLVEQYGKAQAELDELNRSLPDKLKKSVLQEAIQGRLVPQDANDEPASELLKRIRKEKEQLVKEGKLKKKDLESKPIEEDEIPFEIPKGWEWVRLKDISESILYGVSESAKVNGRYKLLRITDIQNNNVEWESVPYTDFDEIKAKNYFLQKNDILFARTGGTVGKSYLVDDCPEDSIYASYLIRVRLIIQVYSRYIKSFFESPAYWSQVTDNLSGTGQPNCNGEKLSNLLIPLPPLSEQRRIVAKIEELFAQIDKLKA